MSIVGREMAVNLEFRFRDAFPDTPLPVIIDIGAADHPETPVGLGKLEALCLTGDAHVIGFDGDKRTFEALKAKESPYRSYYNYFIADGTARKFYVTNNVWTGSLYKPDRTIMDSFGSLGPMTQLMEIIDVETVTLDSIEEIDDVDAIKVDAQGAGLEILQGAERLLKSTLLVQSEVEFIPLYEGQSLFADIDGYMRSQGFLLHNLPTPASRLIWPVGSGTNHVVGSQSLWSDAIFTRDFRTFGQLSDEKLWKLAQIFHDAYRFFDFVIRILLILDQRNDSNNAEIYCAPK